MGDAGLHPHPAALDTAGPEGKNITLLRRLLAACLAEDSIPDPIRETIPEKRGNVTLWEGGTNRAIPGQSTAVLWALDKSGTDLKPRVPIAPQGAELS